MMTMNVCACVFGCVCPRMLSNLCAELETLLQRVSQSVKTHTKTHGESHPCTALIMNTLSCNIVWKLSTLIKKGFSAIHQICVLSVFMSDLIAQH